MPKPPKTSDTTSKKGKTGMAFYGGGTRHNELGEILEKTREEEGLSPKEFADAIGLFERREYNQHPYISVLQGQIALRGDIVGVIASYLNMEEQNVREAYENPASEPYAIPQKTAFTVAGKPATPPEQKPEL